MCGLFGAFSAAGGVLTAADIDRLHDIGRRSQRRGQDASGLVVVTNGHRITTAKAATGIARLLRDPMVEGELRSAASHASAIFGHTRLATHGSIRSTKNNHPMLSPRWAIVHNGWITNHQAIVERFGGADRGDYPTTDSYAINLVLEQWLDSTVDSPVWFLELLEGEFTFIAWSTDGYGMAYTNVGNLCLVSTKSSTYVSSEAAFLPASLRSEAIGIDIGVPVVFSEASDETMSVRQLPVIASVQIEHDTPPTDPSKVAVFTAQLTDMYESITAWSGDFRRCAACVLPVHFPHLEIDDQGVCNICREYQPPEYGGIELLQEQLDRRLVKGSRKVLVGLSGGRDSCYSMHLVRELGYEPVAFTYDWGLVTNEARENMAKMCGRLGAEHILVARDIQQVKRRLRGGIEALLGTPDLAIVPLLMSGDKSWMHWAQKVSRERGNLPIVMGTHRAETTGFKSALATGKRVRAFGEVDHFWKLELLPLARMSARYLAFGLREPKALPILLHDAVPGAWHYYVRKQDMVLPFDYVEWNAELIESTITERYDWGFESITSKWRAGDGTAVVYNLLYLAGLGFSELETFLSSQIRSSDVTRAAALEQVRFRHPLDIDQLVGYLNFIEADVEKCLAGFVRVVSESEGVRQ